MPNFDDALSLLETSTRPGPAFYRDAVAALSLGLGCRWAAVVRLSGCGDRGEVLAASDRGTLIEPGAYLLAATPCQEVYRDAEGGLGACFHPGGLAKAFPKDPRLAGLSDGSYRGQVIKDPEGAALGHVYIMDEGPMAGGPEAGLFFRLICQRIAADYALWRSELALGESKASFAAFADHAPAVICLKDREGRYLFVNKRFRDFHGIAAKDALGKTADDLFEEKFSHAVLAQDQEVFDKGSAVEREHRVHTKTGDHSFLEIKFPVFRDPEDRAGQPIALGLISSETTAYRNAAAALLKAEEDYGEIFDQAPLGIYRSSMKGRFTRVNPSLAGMLGYATPEEMIERIEDIRTQFYVDPDQRPRLQKRVVKAGTVRGLESQVLRKDGSKIWISETFRTIRGPTGELIYFEGFMEDITSRRAAEAARSDSELLKRSVLEYALDCIVTIDEEGCIVEFNPAAEKSFGYRREAVIGQLMVDIIVPPALRGAHRFGFRRHIETGETTILGKRIELMGLRADGHEFPIEIAITKTVIQGKKVFTAYIRDIEKQKEVEAALEAARQERAAAEALLSDAIEHMSEGIVVYDAEDRLMLCNGTFRAFYGYEDGDVPVGAGFEELGWLDIKKASVAFVPGQEKDYLRQRMAYRRKLEGELEVQLQDGRWLQVRDRRTAAGGVVSLQADVTERKTAEIQLLAAKEQAEAATEAKSRFLANMSHELRTPLNAILGYTELIADGIYGDVPERIGSVIGRVEQNGRHLLGQVNNVLDLSKIEAGQLTLSLVDYSLQDIVDTVMATAEALAAEKGLTLRTEIEDDLPVGFGDPQRIVQILLNLVGNAIKFSEDGEVALSAAKDQACFLLSVSDDGPGISPEDQRVIFDEFQQGDGSRAQAASGTGLGLAIAKRMAELHGGALWVQSELGEGASFFLRLPVRVEDQAETA